MGQDQLSTETRSDEKARILREARLLRLPAADSGLTYPIGSSDDLCALS